MAAAAALVLLVATLAVTLAGVAELTRGRVEKRALLARSGGNEHEDVAARLHGRLDVRLRATPLGNRLAVRLAAAGIETRPLDFCALVVALAVLGYVVGETFLPTWMAVAAALGTLGMARAWVRYKQAQRRDRFVAQLPDVARVLSNAAAAGLAMRSAVAMVAEELDDPAGAEMRLATEELRLGQSMEGALANLERRMPSREVGVLTSTLIIHQRAGGSLVRALSDMAETLEERKELAREVRTVMSGSVFTGYLVAVMGVGSVLLLDLILPGALEEMSSEPLGRLALAVAAVLYVIGFVLVRRTTRIET
ncbi:MAG TPA: type II secretion system F family protein [Acidimicrobiales bacterium]|nr:type II secretion system F family protein [Acidimicrobiales bacterium]